MMGVTVAPGQEFDRTWHRLGRTEFSQPLKCLASLCSCATVLIQVDFATKYSDRRPFSASYRVEVVSLCLIAIVPERSNGSRSI